MKHNIPLEHSGLQSGYKEVNPLDMEYLAKFDAQGNRLATVCTFVHYTTDEERRSYINDGYIPISEEDYQHYIGNRGAGENGTGYIRDKETGKPVSAPPAPAVKEEPQEPPVDEERLAAFEAMAAQEARLDELEAAIKNLKGGE